MANDLQSENLFFILSCSKLSYSRILKYYFLTFSFYSLCSSSTSQIHSFKFGNLSPLQNQNPWLCSLGCHCYTQERGTLCSVLKADTHEGFCSRSMLQDHFACVSTHEGVLFAPGACSQVFNRLNIVEHFAGWKFCSRGWIIPLKSLVHTGAKPLVCIGLKLYLPFDVCKIIQ